MDNVEIIVPADSRFNTDLTRLKTKEQLMEKTEAELKGVGMFPEYPGPERLAVSEPVDFMIGLKLLHLELMVM